MRGLSACLPTLSADRHSVALRGADEEEAGGAPLLEGCLSMSTSSSAHRLRTSSTSPPCSRHGLRRCDLKAAAGATVMPLLEPPRRRDGPTEAALLPLPLPPTRCIRKAGASSARGMPHRPLNWKAVQHTGTPSASTSTRHSPAAAAVAPLLPHAPPRLASLPAQEADLFLLVRPIALGAAGPAPQLCRQQGVSVSLPEGPPSPPLLQLRLGSDAPRCIIIARVTPSETRCCAPNNH